MHPSPLAAAAIASAAVGAPPAIDDETVSSHGGRRACHAGSECVIVDRSCGVVFHHPTRATQHGQNGASSSAANVIPTEKLAHGLSVAKGIFASIGRSARKSLEDLNETPAMQKVGGNGRVVIGLLVAILPSTQ